MERIRGLGATFYWTKLSSAEQTPCSHIYFVNIVNATPSSTLSLSIAAENNRSINFYTATIIINFDTSADLEVGATLRAA